MSFLQFFGFFAVFKTLSFFIFNQNGYMVDASNSSLRSMTSTARNIQAPVTHKNSDSPVSAFSSISATTTTPKPAVQNVINNKIPVQQSTLKKSVTTTIINHLNLKKDLNLFNF